MGNLIKHDKLIIFLVGNVSLGFSVSVFLHRFFLFYSKGYILLQFRSQFSIFWNDFITAGAILFTFRRRLIKFLCLLFCRFCVEETKALGVSMAKLIACWLLA
jgi:hypothetical protein